MHTVAKVNPPSPLPRVKWWNLLCTNHKMYCLGGRRWGGGVLNSFGNVYFCNDCGYLESVPRPRQICHGNPDRASPVPHPIAFPCGEEGGIKLQHRYTTSSKLIYNMCQKSTEILTLTYWGLMHLQCPWNVTLLAMKRRQFTDNRFNHRYIEM